MPSEELRGTVAMCTGGEDKKARGLSRRDTVSRVPWKSDRFDIGSFGVGLSRLSKTMDPLDRMARAGRSKTRLVAAWCSERERMT